MRLAICWQHLTLFKFNVSIMSWAKVAGWLQVCSGAVPGAALTCGGTEVTVGEVSKSLKDIKRIESQIVL